MNPFGHRTLAQAMAGGNSDCRNRCLQTMFQLVGYGDHAGSGLPKIYTNWAGQHWRRPVLYELPEPEQTLMELRMSSLVPADAVAQLEGRLGARFTLLPETARLALITAQVEGVVSHDRLKQICTDHPADLTKMLGGLVRDGLLSPNGAGRGTVYFLPWQRRSTATVFDITDQAGAPPELGSIPPELAGQPPELAALSPEPVSATASVVQPLLDWTAISPAIQARLVELGRPVAGSGRVAPPTLRATILALCTGRHMGLRVLAHVLERDPDDLRKRSLTPMVKEGVLRTAYTNSRDPRQAYTAAPKPAEEEKNA